MAFAVSMFVWMAFPHASQSMQVSDDPSSPEVLAEMAWDKSFAGQPLDLNGFTQTFADDFDKLSITTDLGAGPWFAPVHGPFGGASFRPPTAIGPFFVEDGRLTIRMEKRDDRWRSGLMQSMNSRGEGFAQRYGYFEMKARFPPGHGSWPAFWLLSANQYADPSQTRVEIDIVEAYGKQNWSRLHSSVHLWPARRLRAGEISKHWWKSTQNKINGNMFGDNWHTYGAAITPEHVIIYFNRAEVARFPMLREFHTPLYVVVDLALFEKETPNAVSPMDMIIDYVRVWQKPEWETADTQ
ncbi:glycoside hydrolase family 16 protein [Microvirga sp. 2YAF29]|uniref:glycoside hydrolase family 16 protein n=1 Tax=Microvirga sp. 2YAF29 TaxID=3233031 RepID=UPI003F9DAA73